MLGFLSEKSNFSVEDVSEVVTEIQDELGVSSYGSSAPIPLKRERVELGHHDSSYDIDLSSLQFESDLVDGISRKIDGLSAERYGDRLLRLERSLLRLERVNLEILTMLQKLVAGISKSQQVTNEQRSP